MHTAFTDTDKKEGGGLWVEECISRVGRHCGLIKSSRALFVQEKKPGAVCHGVGARGAGCQAEEFACCLEGCSGQLVSAQMFTIPSIFIPP